jgi:hypothetical protein
LWTNPSSRIGTRIASKNKRTTLPLGDRLQHGIGDRRDQVRRDVESVQLLEVSADLAHRHAAREYRYDLAVEVGKTALVLAISFGSNIPARSRGTSSVTFDVPVSIVFLDEPLRRLIAPSALPLSR